MARLSVDDSYLDYYGFTHDPFAARMPGFKFFSARRKQVLGQLHHLARYSQMLLVVTGPWGSGKSLLRQALLATSNKQSIQSIVITPDNLDAGGVLSQTAQALGCHRHSTNAILSQAGQLALHGQSIYLLVDDAHILGNEDLLDLLTLAVGNTEGRLKVFLFAEPNLGPRLSTLVPDRENCHIIELQPYDEQETTAYLAQRLEGAGSELSCLNRAQIRHIHQLSGGWPGEINQAARTMLNEALPTQTGRRSAASNDWIAEIPWKHVLGILVVLCMIAAALLFQDEGSTTGTQQPLEDSTQNAAAAANQSQDINGNGQRLPLPLTGEDEPLVREPLAAAAGGESEQLYPPKPTTSSAKPAANSSPANARPATPPASVPASAPTSRSLSAPIPNERPTPTPAATPPTNKPAASLSPAAEATSVGSAGWYLKQPANNFLLQILGSRSEQTAQEILRLHGNQYHYFVKQHQGLPLYVVTYGSFSSRQAALAATQKLPALLQAEKPWARTLSSVQQEIRPPR